MNVDYIISHNGQITEEAQRFDGICWTKHAFIEGYFELPNNLEMYIMENQKSKTSENQDNERIFVSVTKRNRLWETISAELYLAQYIHW